MLMPAFSQKMTEIAKHLDGVGDELKPKDLNLLVVGCFRGSLALAFELQVLEQHNKADSSPLTTEKWDVVVDSLKTKHHSLETNDMWEVKKVHNENPAQALQASIDCLSKKLGGKLQPSNPHLQNGHNDGNNKVANPAHKDLICHHCGVKGHIKPNCPKKDAPKEQPQNGGDKLANKPNPGHGSMSHKEHHKH